MTYEDDDNFVVLSRCYCGAGPPACVGDGIYLNAEEQGGVIGHEVLLPPVSADQAYLKLVRRSDMFHGYWSSDGQGWLSIGEGLLAEGVEPSRLGLYVADGNQGASEIPADFDYFCLGEAAARIYLPLILSGT